MPRKGVLLINLGTPDHCDLVSVYKYLTEFLNDKRVIDLPLLLRMALVNFLIIPFRLKNVVRAYSKIWSKNGSPLLSHSLQIKDALTAALQGSHQVELGMRYGNLNIKKAMLKLRGCHQLTIIPLFPQYSSAATGSAIEDSLKFLMKEWNIPHVKILKDFYNDEGYITAYVKKIEEYISNKTVDMLIFSFHGLPLRHIIKSGCIEYCNQTQTCKKNPENIHFCYRAQCYKTADLIAEKLSLNKDQYTVSFQSRLGKTPWIMPYTDVVLPDLIAKGVKNIAIVSPSFVADCLETLEEINIRTRAQWKELGGENFIFVPCVNADPVWIQALANMV